MGNPFVHIELNSDDVGRSKKFYKSVFDWKLTDMKEMGYTLLDVKTKNGVGGGMQKKQMAEAPSAWLPYVQVDDVKKTLVKAAKEGAKVVLEAMPIGEMGEIGIFVDPSGASLGIWANAAPAKKEKKKDKKEKKKKNKK